MSIKLIASDIDGTLLPFGGKISDRTRAAIAACREQGIIFTIATGRWTPSAMKINAALGQTGGVMIVANGGAVTDFFGTPVKEWTMPVSDAWKVYEIARQYNVTLHAFVRNGIYRVNTQALSREYGVRKDYIGDDYRVSEDDITAFEKYGLAAAYKMEAYADDIRELQRAKDAISALGVSVTSSYADNIEIMSPGMGKGAAVEWLAKQNGIAFDECLAMGDNTNDADMLRHVGWPVAVGNAVDELKAVARIIAPKCEDDGAAIIIERALKGEIA